MTSLKTSVEIITSKENKKYHKNKTKCKKKRLEVSRKKEVRSVKNKKVRISVKKKEVRSVEKKRLEV